MITIAFALAVAVVFVLMVRLHSDRFGSRQILLLSPLLLTVAIVVLGVVMAHDNSSQSLAPHWPIGVIYGLLILHLPLALVLVQKSKGHRYFASCIIAGELCCSLCAAFFAAMLVTGDCL